MSRRPRKLLVASLLLIVASFVALYGYRLARAERHLLLEQASAVGDSARVALLLRLGADPNGVWDSHYYTTYGWSVFESSRPLHLAASGGHVQTVRLLLAAGASPAARDSEGDTALSTAVRENHPEVVRILSDAGSPSSLLYSRDTVFDVAKRFGHTEVLNILEEHQRK